MPAAVPRPSMSHSQPRTHHFWYQPTLAPLQPFRRLFRPCINRPRASGCLLITADVTATISNPAANLFFWTFHHAGAKSLLRAVFDVCKPPTAGKIDTVACQLRRGTTVSADMAAADAERRGRLGSPGAVPNDHRSSRPGQPGRLLQFPGKHINILLEGDYAWSIGRRTKPNAVCAAPAHLVQES